MAMKQSIKVVVGVCLIGCLAVVSPVHAGDSSYVKDGWYLGLQAVHNSMSDDDFAADGTILTVPGDLFDLPEVDAGTGFGVVLGMKRDRVALELGYQRSSHDTSSFFVVAPGESEASYNVIDLNFKVDVLARDKLRPYILFGFGIPWLTIDGSAFDGTKYYDETFHGFAFNLGAGVAYYLRPQWALTGGLMYRYSWFSSVEGNDIDDSLTANVLAFTLGIAYTF